MKKTIVSAPAKVHLMGEHAIVHGRPALLAAINRRLVATVQDSDKLSIRSNRGNKLIRESVRVVCDQFRIRKPNVSIFISSAVPPGRHVGSSAVVSVATVGALTYHLKKIWNPTLINKLAYEVEKLQHGTPSGGDNSTVTYGGFVWFRKELEDLKTIWQLPYKIHKNIGPFRLMDTGSPKENTGEMVGLVHEWVKKDPKSARDTFAENEQATKDVAVALKAGDEKLLVSAIMHGERSLEKMGVVSKKTVPVIREIERSGGAAKILGGGGKTGAVGFLLCYHKNKMQLQKIATKHNYPLQDIELGEEGVRLESGRQSV